MPDPALPMDPVARANLALAVLVVDPAGMGGLWLRARIGPARAAVMDCLAALPLPPRRLHPSIDDDALFGGTDLAASLAAGAHRRSAGVLADPAALILPMAERAPPALAARLALHLDAGTSCLIALDEGDGADEGLAPALAERLGLFLDLSDFDLIDSEALRLPDTLPAAWLALARLHANGLPETALQSLARAAVDLGIDTLRAPLLAARAALAIAALRGLDAPDQTCLQQAAELCLAHRATQTPAQAEPPQDTPPNPSPDRPETAPQDSPQLDQIPDDIVLEAVRAALPQGVLDSLAQARALRSAKGGAGTGAKVKGNHRGRPLPARAGRMGHGQRVDILATLRAAAPMQALRAADPKQALRGCAPLGTDTPLRLSIRKSDLRIKRYQHTSDRVLIFAVDASGSSAFARLAEAKGAVELLLARAYARRDHVALLAFRGTGCEVVLPPTRSLVATKRRLAGMAGGGGTPLAMGLRRAYEVALQARARGMTPTLALLTDGRGNIALDGTPGRAAADTDTAAMARLWAGSGLPSLAIDIAQRPSPALADLARSMGARYVPLPRADAQRLSMVLQAGLE